MRIISLLHRRLLLVIHRLLSVTTLLLLRRVRRLVVVVVVVVAVVLALLLGWRRTHESALVLGRVAGLLLVRRMVRCHLLCGRGIIVVRRGFATGRVGGRSR